MADRQTPEKQNENEQGVQEMARPKVKRPNNYHVFLLNDDFTPMDFVVWLIQKVFHKSLEESTQLMIAIHSKGRGLCGTFSYDVARTKIYQVKSLVDRHEHPLQCIMEEAT